MTMLEFEELIANTKEPKFQMGDSVASKITGFPGVGKVIALIPSLTYCGLRQKYEVPLWDRIFPNWREEYVYLILFEEPRKYMTFEEYNSSFTEEVKNWYKPGAMEHFYNDKIELVRTIIYPEQDLELFQ